MSQTGIQLTEKMKSLYNQVDNFNSVEKFEQEWLTILANSSEERAKIPQFDKKPLIQNINEKMGLIDLFNSLLEKYNQLSDQKFNAKSVNIDDNFTLISSALDTMKFPEEVKTKIDPVGLTYKRLLMTKRYDRLEILFYLSQIMNEIWRSDVKNCKFNLDAMFVKYESAIKNIPASVFDVEKISKTLNEPYSEKAVIINVYKLRLREKAFHRKKEIQDKLDRISDALTYFERLNAEIIKKKGSDTEFTRLVDKTGEIMKGV
jgi:hypothetical protein